MYCEFLPATAQWTVRESWGVLSVSAMVGEHNEKRSKTAWHKMFKMLGQKSKLGKTMWNFCIWLRKILYRRISNEKRLKTARHEMFKVFGKNWFMGKQREIFIFDWEKCDTGEPQFKRFCAFKIYQNNTIWPVVLW